MLIVHLLLLAGAAVTGALSESAASAPPTLPAPTGLSAVTSVPGDLAVSLRWTNGATGPVQFQVERCRGLGCTDFVLLSTLDWSGHGPWLNDVGLDEATFYSYRVRHAGSTGSSAFSSVATALTGHAQPLQVLDLRSFYENRQVALFWTDAAGNETRYEVERYRVGSGETSFRTIAVLPPDSTSFIDASTQVGAIYVYRVRPWRFDVFGGAPDVTTVAAN